MYSKVTKNIKDYFNKSPLNTNHSLDYFTITILDNLSEVFGLCLCQNCIYTYRDTSINLPLAKKELLCQQYSVTDTTVCICPSLCFELFNGKNLYHKCI